MGAKGMMVRGRVLKWLALDPNKAKGVHADYGSLTYRSAERLLCLVHHTSLLVSSHRRVNNYIQIIKRYSSFHQDNDDP
jgi:hypothetical protein